VKMGEGDEGSQRCEVGRKGEKGFRRTLLL